MRLHVRYLVIPSINKLLPMWISAFGFDRMCEEVGGQL